MSTQIPESAVVSTYTQNKIISFQTSFHKQGHLLIARLQLQHNTKIDFTCPCKEWTFMITRQCILMTLVIPCLFLKHHHEILEISMKWLRMNCNNLTLNPSSSVNIRWKLLFLQYFSLWLVLPSVLYCSSSIFSLTVVTIERNNVQKISAFECENWLLISS